ncbi:MAG: glycosyl hydrolase 53 family protein [Muribaculaceae bacterium]|nr:glycosyl hydrolase 53 family protein [Muribaculaceae bacterium]
MRTFYSILLLSLAFFSMRGETSAFARGADVSWCTEMEADGRRFYNADGVETDIFALMKDIDMNAIRLRVWVNPQGFGYGAWCDKADVVAKAKRAHAQGLDLLIDFHYSDFFADPGTQALPLDWNGFTREQVKTAMVTHTQDVLQALKAEGIEPKWVQVGNETNSGMVWDYGKIDWNSYGSDRFTDYAELSNVGYDAVKEMLPNAQVIIHLANAHNVADYDCWFLKDFKEAGGKFDMIGLSHYPDCNNWNSDADGAVSNINAARNIKAVGEKFNVPVMIVETGFSQFDENKAKQVMQDLFDKVENLPQCVGIFYWEPEVDGQWKPAYYNTVGWGAYGMGAFTTDGRPTAALDAFNSNYNTVPGDVNGDGNVTSADVTALYNWMLNNDASDIVNGDQNGDGNITAADVTAVYNVLLGN